MTMSLDGAIADPERFAVVFDAHYQEIRRYVGRRLDLDIAEDLAAETFLIAFRRRDSFDATRGGIRPWLYGIATNLIGRHRRAELRRYRALSRSGRPPADQARAMAVRARTLGGVRRRHRMPALSRVVLAAAAVSLVLVGGFVAVPMLGGSDGETAAVQEPAAVLGAAADRLAAQPPGAGAWWRREMLHVWRGRTKANPTFTVEGRVKEVLWVDREGKQRTEQGDVVAKPFTPTDERAWKDAGSPKLCKPSDDCQLGSIFFTPLGLTLKSVAGLPTDPEALKAEMLRHFPANGVDSQEAWLGAQASGCSSTPRAPRPRGRRSTGSSPICRAHGWPTASPTSTAAPGSR
ncbi:sigma factor [Nonomuraea dietziae]|uniref:sigma factor n=1 Tax=Nonomuraea dietziae TaxID=65515 RepID=UPI0033D19217